MAEEADGNFEASAFEALEKDFQEVLQELVGDKSLEHFRQEYEKLHRALKGSHENEKRLIKKCRELNSEIVSNAVKVQTALKLSQEDHSTITALQKEIERAWKMVEGSHEKEQRAKDAITTLKTEIANLSRLVEQGAGLSINQENTLNNLIVQKNELTKHRDMLQAQVSQQQTSYNAFQKKVSKLEQEKAANEESLDKLKELLADKKVMAEAKAREKEKLDHQLKESREVVDARQKDIEAKQEEVRIWGVQCVEWAEKVRIAKNDVEQQSAKQAQVEVELQQLKKQIEREVLQRLKLKDEQGEKQTLIGLKEDELRKIKKEMDKLRKEDVRLNQSLVESIQESKIVDESKKQLRADLIQTTAEIEKLKMTTDAGTKQRVAMTHERDILHKNLVKGKDKTKTQADVVLNIDGDIHTLTKEIQRWKIALQKVLKRVGELEKQRAKAQTELTTCQTKNGNCEEEIRYKDATLTEYMKQIADVKTKLGQQKNLFEAVRSDRNVYSKNLLESQEEIVEMRKRFKAMYRQIDHMKEEIKEKEQGMIKKHFDHHRLTKEVEKIKDGLEKADRRQQNLERVVEQQKIEMKTLEETIQEAEQERQNQNKELEGVRGERNILSSQLMRRNDELMLLYEKIKLQHSILEKGEIQFKGRCEELRFITTRHQAELKKVSQTSAHLHNVEELRKELYQVQKDLLQEKTKVKALAEELENPMNVHRWRKLEGSDPQTFALVNKIRTLQTRLIAKTQDCLEMDKKINGKEQQYGDLKAILARQPGPEIIETLDTYRELHSSKKKQLMTMTTELSSYAQQIQDYKDESERLHRQLLNVKKKYFNQKKREQLEREQARGDSKVIHIAPPQTRFTGGGFNLSI